MCGPNTAVIKRQHQIMSLIGIMRLHLNEISFELCCSTLMLHESEPRDPYFIQILIKMAVSVVIVALPLKVSVRFHAGISTTRIKTSYSGINVSFLKPSFQTLFLAVLSLLFFSVSCMLSPWLRD